MSTSTDSSNAALPSKPVDHDGAPKSEPAVAIVPWRPLVGVAFAVLTFFAAQFAAAGLVILGYAASHGVSGDEAIHWLSSSVTGQTVFAAIYAVFVMVAVACFIKRFGLNLSIIGLRRPRWSDLAYAVAMVLPYYITVKILSVIATQIVPSLNLNQKQQLGYDNVVGNEQLLLTAIGLVLIPPIIEEILFRGMLYGSLKKLFPLVIAAATTSILFAAGHLSQGGADGPLYVAALVTFTLSLFLIWLRELTGGLWASIYLHMINNSIAFLVVFVRPTL